MLFLIDVVARLPCVSGTSGCGRAAQGEKEYADKGGGDWLKVKGKGKGKFGKGRTNGKKGVYGFDEGDEA